MTIYVGGLRARLIHDSLYYMLRKALTDLGWFNTEASHTTVTMVAEPYGLNVEVPINTIALADEDMSGEDIEMGSNLADHNWSFYVDFYAENDTLGLHLIRDVKDILEGRMPSIGRKAAVVTVFDYTLATPVPIFTCQIESVQTQRAHDFPHPWLRFWHSCAFTVIDTYGGDAD